MISTDVIQEINELQIFGNVSYCVHNYSFEINFYNKKVHILFAYRKTHKIMVFCSLQIRHTYIFICEWV